MDVRLIAWLISEVGFPAVVSLALLRLVFVEAGQLRRELRMQRAALQTIAHELAHIKRELTVRIVARSEDVAA
ncbi:MAG: hypothetical protein KGJ45_11520 [Elusimicrobia bacterium]|nr:hypothetical protein [Elusimicrobiota bacterium]